MTRHRVPFATLFVQPHPQPAVLRVNILDCHSERRADPGEGIDHEPDQSAIETDPIMDQRIAFRFSKNTL